MSVTRYMYHPGFLPEFCLKVTGYLCACHVKGIGNVYLIQNEEREQLDSGGGGALSQGAGHDESFFDSIIPDKFIYCLTREKR